MCSFFSKTPHCNHQSCNKCGLYADAESADKEAMTKAAKDAAKSVSTGRKGVNINIDALLKNPDHNRNRHHNKQPRRRPAGMPAHQIPHGHFVPPPQGRVPILNQLPPHLMNQFGHNPPNFGFNGGGGGYHGQESEQRHNRNHRR